MENNIPTKMLSFLLSVLLLFYAIPSVIFAEAAVTKIGLKWIGQKG